MIATTLYVLLIFIVLFVLSSLISNRARRLLPDPLKHWSDRTSHWIRGLFTSRAEAGPVTVGDVLVLAGFVATALTIFSQLREASLQTAKENLEAESRRLHELVGTQEQEIRGLSLRLRNLQAGQAVPQLRRPEPDLNIIGSHVDLQWDYQGHNPNSKYVVEVVRISETSHRAATANECTFDIGIPCTIIALDPASERSRLPLRLGDQLLPGSYYWRVVPGELQSAPTVRSEGRESAPRSKVDKSGDWSAFGSFTIYPTIKGRIVRNKEILIGTNFLQDTGFSKRGPNGEAEGYDIDLINTIVQGCLDLDDKQNVIYDPNRCSKSVTTFLQSQKEYAACAQRSPYLRKIAAGASFQQNPAQYTQLKAEIVPVAEWKDWLGMLQKKEIDVFIGQATRAQVREKRDVKFTSGYFRDRTAMLVKQTEVCNDLPCLAKKGMTVGVIAETTNHWLANLLKKEKQLMDRMKVVTFTSFPALESAIDHGDVDAIIIDASLGRQLMDDLKELKGFENYKAWRTYLNDPSYIGYGKEQFAIAVARDTRRETSGGVDLLGPIQQALDSKAMRAFIQCVYNPTR